MTIFDFQSLQLSPGQRRQLELQKKIRTAFINPVLAEQMKETFEIMDARKEQGAKPDRVWFPDRQEKGTPSIAEWMGYGQTEL